MPTELPRLSVTFQPQEMAALQRFALAHGMRPAEAVHEAALAMLAAGGVGDGRPDAAGADPAADLAALGKSLERCLTILAAATPAARDAEEHRREAAADLRAVAEFCGEARALLVADGLLDPPDDGGKSAFG